MQPSRHLAPCALSLLLGCAGDDPSTVADAATDRGAADATAVIDSNTNTAADVAQAPGLVRALTITDVSLFQAVKVPLLAAGSVATGRSIPVIAGRSAVVRVYVRPEAGYQARGVEGELTVRRGDQGTILRDRRLISRASRDDDTSSVFQFEVPEEAVGPDTRLSVRLLAPGGAEVETGTPDGARFPSDGASLPVPAQDDGGGIDIVLVPMRWDADKSGRLPDTSPEQIERMRSALRAMYPVREVRITVHEPVAWSRGLLPSGSADFGAMISSLRFLRTRDEVPSSHYYYGMVAPTEYFDEYCQGPCTLGQGYLSAFPDDPRGRVAAGLGFDDDRAAETFVHEIGHNHGRAHAPCGAAAGPDPEFPYRGGTIGGWGYDERRRGLVRPNAFDFMGYCQPRWISDYNYTALWERIIAVNGSNASIDLRGSSLAARPRLRHRVLRFDHGAESEWLDALDLPPAAGGNATLRWLDAAGLLLRRSVAQADPLGDSDEVHVLVPPSPSGASSVEVVYEGRTRRVALPASW